MADEERNEQQEEETTEETTSSTDSLGEAGKRALEAERKRARQAEKELKAIREQLKERDDADKSELERLQERAAAAEKRAEEAEGKIVRAEVAAAAGLSAAQAKRLVGSTREELEADAAEMRTELGLDKEEEKEQEEEKDDRGTGLPKENLRSGASNEADEEPDAGKLADSILTNRF